jgi:hypothetical protein
MAPGRADRLIAEYLAFKKAFESRDRDWGHVNEVLFRDIRAVANPLRVA